MQITLMQFIAKGNQEFLAKGNHDGYRLMLAFYAELVHGLMGMFPVIESESEEMVITTDLNLLKKVLEKVSPRRFIIRTQLIYVHPETGMAFSILGTNKEALEKAKQYQTLTQPHFEQLCNAYPEPFKWAQGLVADDMSAEEFKETLEKAAQKISE